MINIEYYQELTLHLDRINIQTESKKSIAKNRFFTFTFLFKEEEINMVQIEITRNGKLQSIIDQKEENFYLK